MNTEKFAANPDGYGLTAIADRPDSRDFYYRPALERIAPSLEPDIAQIEVLDQEKEGAPKRKFTEGDLDY